MIDAGDIAELKAKILASGLTVSDLVSTAWASAVDLSRAPTIVAAPMARAIRLAPQKDWEVNESDGLARVSEDSKRFERRSTRRRPAARKCRSPI